MRVSIVIPAHNEEHHLRACLEAIACQTRMPYEVIVVDNNSTDATATIAEDFPFVRVIAEPRQGIVFARNTGFDAAAGDIIGRIDSDIALPPDWVAHISRFYAVKAHASHAWTGAGWFYNVRVPRLVSFAYGLFAMRLNRLITGRYALWGSNMAITRSQWRTVRSSVHTRTDIHEDLDLALHLGEAGYAITYDTSCVVHAELRRVHSNRDNLWEYLHWWPRALRVHGRKTWPLAWFFGVFILYQAALVLVAMDALCRSVGRRLAIQQRSSV